jgi:CRP-like cAMP-binding protein
MSKGNALDNINIQKYYIVTQPTRLSDLLNRNDDVLREFCAKYPLRHFKKDRPLFYQGEVPQTAFFIKSGVVKVYNITTAGEEKIVSYESEGSFACA